jgi:hypothetical protein
MFAEELLEDFPEVPLVSNLDIFDLISQKGSDLIALHLLEVEYPLASWVTNRKGSPFKALPEFVKSHPPRVEPGYPKYENARVLVNSEAYFKGISEDVWAFKVGNYQVCEKWLKDRRRRSLTEREVNHYQMMLVAVQRTMRLMAEIDEIIETNGGWPAVFALVPKSTTKKASS